MPSPPSGQGALNLDTPPDGSPVAPEAGAPAPRPPATSPAPGTIITRLDVNLDEPRARELAITLGLTGYRDVADAIRHALEELPDGGRA